ncbi:NifB/NifX family molybdenum-iron cluster-binding protein [bacterium]|nr:NifB/NifX family molybdenum-iron cluster-binding protein [bacterium]
MLRFAVPLGSADAARVHEVLDNAEKVMVISLAGDGSFTREILQVCECPSACRARWFRDHGIQWVICGGISAPFAARLAEKGVHVVPHFAGTIELAIDSFITGRIPDDHAYAL